MIIVLPFCLVSILFSLIVKPQETLDLSLKKRVADNVFSPSMPMGSPRKVLDGSPDISPLTD